MFSGLVPGPLQMLTAALLAVPLRVNLPVALATTLYTNPFTIGPLYLVAYLIGRLISVGGDGAATAPPPEMDWSHPAHRSRRSRRLDAVPGHAARRRPGCARADPGRARLRLRARSAGAPMSSAPGAGAGIARRHGSADHLRSTFTAACSLRRRRSPSSLSAARSATGSSAAPQASVARLPVHDLHHRRHHRLRRDHRPLAIPRRARVHHGHRDLSASA